MWVTYITKSDGTKVYQSDPEWEETYKQWLSMKKSADWIYGKEFIAGSNTIFTAGG